MNPISFKRRACDTIVNCAKDFKSVFIDYDYLVYSESFTIQPYYILSAMAGNYKHLTGVNSVLAPYDFFEKCINGTLNETDFDFIKKGESENFVKGVVRNKIIALPLMATIFTEKLTAEENFIQGAITCSLATAGSQITLGFENRINARLKTLLRGNVIDNSKAVDISLVLRRGKDNEKFDTIIQGDAAKFCELHPNIFDSGFEKNNDND